MREEREEVSESKDSENQKHGEWSDHGLTYEEGEGCGGTHTATIQEAPVIATVNKPVATWMGPTSTQVADQES